MNRTKSQFHRIIELDRQIRAGRYPNCLSFAVDWEVTPKTIQRDIDFLRDQQGAPLVYDRVKKGFYYTDSTWLMPSLMMTQGELLALLMAARSLEQYRGMPIGREAEGLLRKLAGVLPERISLNPAEFEGRFTFRGPPARAVDPEIFKVVLRGLTAGQTLKIRYRPFEMDAGKALKDSFVQPYHLANLQGEWYVFGVHRGHTDIRQFALARIERAGVEPDRFAIPTGFDPGRLLEGVFGRYTGTGEGAGYRIRLLFAKEIASWIADREWHAKQTLIKRKSGAVEIRFQAQSLFEVQRWVLSWGHWVRVLGPAELRRRVKEEVGKMSLNQR